MFLFLFQIDESSKKKPQIQPARVFNTEALEQRLIDLDTPAPASDTVDHALLEENENQKVTEKELGKEKNSKKKSKESKKAAKKLKKEEKIKQAKEKSGKSKSESGSKTTESDKEKLEKQFTHVKFSFDDYTGLDLTEQRPYHEPQSQTAVSPVPPKKPARGEIIQIHKNDENGNYDELPLIQINDEIHRDDTPITNEGPVNQETTPLSRSSESIPFIDDEAQPRSPTRHVYHDTRIITLTPKNLESHHLQCNPNQQQLQTFIPVPKLRYEPQLQIKAVHILPKIEEQGSQELNGLHKFQYYYTPGFKVCQICHLYLHVCPAIKCFECEFTCHQECFHKVSGEEIFVFLFLVQHIKNETDRKRHRPNVVLCK